MTIHQNITKMSFWKTVLQVFHQLQQGKMIKEKRRVYQILQNLIQITAHPHQIHLETRSAILDGIQNKKKCSLTNLNYEMKSI